MTQSTREFRLRLLFKVVKGLAEAAPASRELLALGKTAFDVAEELARNRPTPPESGEVVPVSADEPTAGPDVSLGAIFAALEPGTSGRSRPVSRPWRDICPWHIRYPHLA